jgi:hypothetical protein
MSQKDGDKSNDITPIGIGGSIRPKSFIDVVSIVQNYFLAEKHGNDLPENLLTLKGKIVISEVGFKGAFISGLVSIFLTPFFVGVIERYIPIFGSYEFTLFDQAFAVALTRSFSTGYSLILASIGRYYIGKLSKRAINWLMAGLTVAGALKIVIAFVFYNTLYASVLDESRVSRFLLWFYPQVSYHALNKIYRFLMGVKPVLLTSASFVVFTTFLMITIPWLFIFTASRKTRRMIERERIWR